MSEWPEVTRDCPCPIFGQRTWCGRSGSVVHCMRVSEPPPGWRVVKRNPDGGVVFGPVDGVPRDRRGTSFREPVRPGREAACERFTRNLTPTLLTSLARQLGVPESPLRDFDVGWNLDRRAYTFSERDAAGRIVGIALRYPDGRKGFVKAGWRGCDKASTFPIVKRIRNLGGSGRRSEG